MVTKKQLKKLKKKFNIPDFNQTRAASLTPEARKNRIKELKEILGKKYNKLQQTPDDELKPTEQRIKELSLKLEGVSGGY